MGFKQAAIRVEREKEFEELKAVVIRAFAPERIERFLRKVKSKGLRIRDWDGVLAQGILEAVADSPAGPGKNAQSLYQSLTVSDQAQMREFYLFKVEEVSHELRAKFQKIYRYY